MPSITKTALSTAAAVALVQFCPAPFLADIPAAVAAGMGSASAAVSAAGIVTGAVLQGVKHNDGVNHPHRRQEKDESGWPICHDELKTTILHFSSPTKGNVLVEGMPPSCITLSILIEGQFHVGNPIPVSPSSILFQNLSNKDMQDIQDALDARHSKL